MTKEFVTLKLSDIKPYPNNPRRNDDAVKYVVKSIEECENLDPIEIDENNVILSGHTRLKALQQLGYTETECIRYDGLTEEQKKNIGCWRIRRASLPNGITICFRMSLRTLILMDSILSLRRLLLQIGLTEPNGTEQTGKTAISEMKENVHTNQPTLTDMMRAEQQAITKCQ